MLNNIFSGLFDSASAAVIPVGTFLLCMGAALALGLVFSLLASVKNRFSKSFLLATALLPAVVCVVIMLVNGNIGAGVAVAGAFSLVRFRSAAGTAKEIVLIFTAMGIGLIAGMGYLAYAALFTLVMGLVFLLLGITRFGERRTAGLERMLTVTIPEELNFTGVFDETFKKYTDTWKRLRVKTTNMGTLFKLKYAVTLKAGADEKAFIDDLRLLNGNLEILLNDADTDETDL